MQIAILIIFFYGLKTSCGKGKELEHIISFSGGKDSTAMLLMMLERKMPIDEIIFCDTGKEFPQMYDHIEKVQKYIGGV